MPTILEAQINPLAVFRGLSLVLLLTVCQPLVVIVCLRMLQKGLVLECLKEHKNSRIVAGLRA